MKFIFVIVVSSILLSCQSNSPKPVEVTIKPQPTWVLQPPQDSASYLYGVGDGKNRKSAIQAALADLVTKISVTINTEITSNLFVQTRVTELVKTDNSRIVSAKAVNIKINQYLVEQIFSPLPTVVHALVKVDRNLLMASYLARLNHHLAKFNSSNVKNLGKFARYKFLQQELAKLPEFEHDRLVATSLDTKLNVRPFLAHEQNVISEFKRLLASFNFAVIAKDKLSLVFAEALENKLAKKNLLANNKSNFTIRITTTRTITHSQGFTIQNFLINLILFEDNKAVSSQQITVKHIGIASGKQIPNLAITKFIKQLPAVTDW